MTDTINPHKWKREHQLALLIALLLGGVAGIIAAICDVTPYGHVWAYSEFIAHSAALISPHASGWAYNNIRFDFYWIIIMLWGIAGATIAGALVISDNSCGRRKGPVTRDGSGEK